MSAFNDGTGAGKCHLTLFLLEGEFCWFCGFGQMNMSVDFWGVSVRISRLAGRMCFPGKTDISATICRHSGGGVSFAVKGRLAIEWIMVRYQTATHKDSGDVNAPNDWCKETRQ